MKAIFEKLMMLICMVVFTTWMMPGNLQAQPGAGVSYQVFYDELSPYGQWMEDPSYGYVWIPAVQNDFRPYCSEGHWVMTEYGNMWVSDYPWGWAPFHYGRWTFDRFYGWVWIPGREWGPAWVTWRSNNAYYGWAPMGPGVSLMMSFESYTPPEDWWIFLPPAYLHHHHWHDYYHEDRNNITIINQTTVINNTYTENNHTYVTGPRADQVKRLTHREVPVYRIRNDGKPVRSEVNNNTVNIYRPAIEEREQRVVPSTVRKTEHPIGQPQPARSGGNLQRSQIRGESQPNKAAPPRNTTVRDKPPDNRPPQTQPYRTEPKQQHQTRQPYQETKQPPPSNQPRSEPNRQPLMHQPGPEPKQQPQMHQQRSEPKQKPPKQQPGPAPKPQDQKSTRKQTDQEKK